MNRNSDVLPAGRRYHPASARDGTRVVVIDNYDSFTFNLVQYLLELGAVVDVYRNDVVSAAQVASSGASHVLMSPGPGRPSDSGVCRPLCRQLSQPGMIPMLGVCLGHQTLCEVLGAQVVRAPRIMHGKVSQVSHDGSGIFVGVPSPFRATRYHSLIVPEESLPAELYPVARTDDAELMAVRHRDLPVYGVQFHPESLLSEHGHRMLENFLSVQADQGSWM